MLMRIRVLILLIVFYFVYMIIGAAVFMAMERPVEKQRCKDAKQFKEKWLNQTRNNEGFTEETLNKFIKNVTIFSGHGISLQGNVKCPANWDFQSSLFFTGTIITTIGYGNLAPTQWYSQIFCIFYALIGIPLFAIMFTGIGEYMSVLAEEVLKKFQPPQNAPEEEVQIVNAFFVFVLIVGGSFIFFQLIPAAIFTFVEGWSYRESVYYCFITLTTVGFGDFVAGTNPEVQYIALYRIMVLFWILFGLAYTFTAIDLIIHSLKAAVSKSKFVDFILYNWAEAEVSLHSEVESLLGDSSSGAEDLADDVFSSPEFAMFRRPGFGMTDNDDDGGTGATTTGVLRNDDTNAEDHLVDPPAEDHLFNPASFVTTNVGPRDGNAAIDHEITGGSEDGNVDNAVNSSWLGVPATNTASNTNAGANGLNAVSNIVGGVMAGNLTTPSSTAAPPINTSSDNNESHMATTSTNSVGTTGNMSNTGTSSANAAANTSTSIALDSNVNNTSSSTTLTHMGGNTGAISHPSNISTAVSSHATIGVPGPALAVGGSSDDSVSNTVGDPTTSTSSVVNAHPAMPIPISSAHIVPANMSATNQPTHTVSNIAPNTGRAVTGNSGMGFSGLTNAISGIWGNRSTNMGEGLESVISGRTTAGATNNGSGGNEGE
ncbi:uncharacterized protein LOC120326434 [Styela clava]